MSSALASKNMKAAQDYAAKRKALTERAKGLRDSNNDKYSYQNAELDTNKFSSDNNDRMSIGGSNVEIHSYGNVERIIVRPFRTYNESSSSLSMSTPPTYPKSIESTNSFDHQFLSPPENPSGTLYDLSDRPILCSSAHNGEVVYGCSDHALYSIKMNGYNGIDRNPKLNTYRPTNQSKHTQMYSKTMGHTDWVC